MFFIIHAILERNRWLEFFSFFFLAILKNSTKAHIKNMVRKGEVLRTLTDSDHHIKNSIISAKHLLNNKLGNNTKKFILYFELVYDFL